MTHRLLSFARETVVAVRSRRSERRRHGLGDDGEPRAVSEEGRDDARQRLVRRLAAVPFDRPLRLLCVCLYNVNRSRTVHKALLSWLREQRVGRAVRVDSGGIMLDRTLRRRKRGSGEALLAHRAASVIAEQNAVLRRQGIRVADWRPKPVSRRALRQADVIFVSDERSRREIELRLTELFPTEPTRLGRVIDLAALDPELGRDGKNLPDPLNAEDGITVAESVEQLLRLVRRRIIPALQPRVQVVAAPRFRWTTDSLWRCFGVTLCLGAIMGGLSGDWTTASENWHAATGFNEFVLKSPVMIPPAFWSAPAVFGGVAACLWWIAHWINSGPSGERRRRPWGWAFGVGLLHVAGLIAVCLSAPLLANAGELALPAFVGCLYGFGHFTAHVLWNRLVPQWTLGY